MHRSLALCLALVLTTVSIATTGFAAEAGPLSFEIGEIRSDRLQLRLNRSVAPRGTTGTSFEVRDLTGFDPMRTEDRERLGLGLKAYRIIAPTLPR